MGDTGVSKSQASRLCAETNERVGAFLDRPIEGEWPYLWLDATYVKARRDHRIVCVAVIVAVAVNTDGRREVLGMTVGNSEAEHFWTEFLRSLARRGLRGVKPVSPLRRLRRQVRCPRGPESGGEPCAWSDKPALPRAFPEKRHGTRGQDPASHRRGLDRHRVRRGRPGRRAPAVARRGRPTVTRLVGALLLEQNGEWAVQRRYMRLETMAPVSDDLTVKLPTMATAWHAARPSQGHRCPALLHRAQGHDLSGQQAGRAPRGTIARPPRA